MGIKQLLVALRDIQTPKHLKDYAGLTLGVDSYVWLHRGAYGCAEQLVRGDRTDRYIAYAIERLRMMRHHGIRPYVVFDGGPLPSKQGTEEERHARRQENLAKARAALESGSKGERELYAKCVDVTPQMAFQLIKYLRKEGIPYVVAPYEADAQLAFLEKEGLIDGIITEDSDLLVFGCQRVLFKLEVDGSCVEISAKDFDKAKELPLTCWSISEFRQMAILSGCDYLPNIPGLGLKTAHQLLRKYKSPDRVIQHIRFEGKLPIPPDYLHQFRRAELTFVHQRVWDPTKQRLVCLHPIPPQAAGELASIEYIGPDIPHQTAAGIATGDLCPVSREEMQDIHPDHSASLRTSPRRTVSAAATTGGTSSFYKLKSKKKIEQVQGQQSLKSFFGKGDQAASLKKAGGATELDSLDAGNGKAGRTSKFFSSGAAGGAAAAAAPSAQAARKQLEQPEELVELRPMVEVPPLAAAGAAAEGADDSGYWTHAHAWSAQKPAIKRFSPGRTQAINTSPASSDVIGATSVIVGSSSDDDEATAGNETLRRPSRKRQREKTEDQQEGLISSPPSASASGARPPPLLIMSPGIEDYDDDESPQSPSQHLVEQRRRLTRYRSSAGPADLPESGDSSRSAGCSDGDIVAALDFVPPIATFSTLPASGVQPLGGPADGGDAIMVQDDELGGGSDGSRAEIASVAGGIFARFAYKHDSSQILSHSISTAVDAEEQMQRETSSISISEPTMTYTGPEAGQGTQGSPRHHHQQQQPQKKQKQQQQQQPLRSVENTVHVHRSGGERAARKRMSSPMDEEDAFEPADRIETSAAAVSWEDEAIEQAKPWEGKGRKPNKRSKSATTIAALEGETLERRSKSSTGGGTMRSASAIFAKFRNPHAAA